jgi:hypothetical protein
MKKTMALLVLIYGCAWPSSMARGDEPKPGAEDAAMTKKDDFFRKIDALRAVKTLTPKTVSKALGLALQFQDVSEDDLSKDFEAKVPEGGAIRFVEIRGTSNQFFSLNVSSGLAVNVEDIRRHFGEETAIHRPDHHAPPDSPWYYVYPGAQEDLKFGVKPGNPDLLLSVILDRTDSR